MNPRENATTVRTSTKSISLVCILYALGLLSGCGKSADTESTASAPASTASAAFSEVAFTTYQSRDSFRLAFLSPSKVRKTWANMSGDAVIGEYQQVGRNITISWDPSASHHGSLSEKLMQTGPCSLTRYERVDRENKVHDDQPQVFQQKEPLCDAVRVVN